NSFSTRHSYDLKKQFIDGNWILANNKETREIINPYNQEVIATVTESDETDTQNAIKAARKAFDHGEWPTLPNTEPGRIVRKTADLLERDAEDLAKLETL